MDTLSLRRIVGIAHREPELRHNAISALDTMLDTVEAQIADLQGQRARIAQALVELEAADPALLERAERVMRLVA